MGNIFEDAWDGATDAVGTMFDQFGGAVSTTVTQVAPSSVIKSSNFESRDYIQRHTEEYTKSARAAIGDDANTLINNEWVSRALPPVAVFTPQGRANLAGDIQRAAPMLDAYVPGASMVINNLLPIAAQQGLFGDVGQNPAPVVRPGPVGGQGPSGMTTIGGGSGMMSPGGAPSWVIPVALGIAAIGAILLFRKG